MQYSGIQERTIPCNKQYTIKYFTVQCNTTVQSIAQRIQHNLTRILSPSTPPSHATPQTQTHTHTHTHTNAPLTLTHHTHTTHTHHTHTPHTGPAHGSVRYWYRSTRSAQEAVDEGSRRTFLVLSSSGEGSAKAVLLPLSVPSLLRFIRCVGVFLFFINYYEFILYAMCVLVSICLCSFHSFTLPSLPPSFLPLPRQCIPPPPTQTQRVS